MYSNKRVNEEMRKAWISLLDEEVAKIWTSETKELRKVAMLLYIVKKEFKNLEMQFDDKMCNLRKQIPCTKDSGFITTNRSIENYNLSLNEVELLSTSSDNSNESVRLLNGTKQTVVDVSPKLNKNTKLRAKKNKTTAQKTLFNKPLQIVSPNADILDSSVICATPKAVIKKRKVLTNLKTRNIVKKTKQLKNNTLTQMLEFSKNTYDSGSTLTDSDKTITDLLPKIDDVLTNSSLQKESFKMEKNQDDTENYDKYCLKKKSDGANYPYREVIRGKERKKLKGWACEECRKYYEAMELTDEELQIKLNMCSKHRSKFQPQEETPPGFWDIDIPTTQESESSSAVCYM